MLQYGRENFVFYEEIMRTTRDMYKRIFGYTFATRCHLPLSPPDMQQASLGVTTVERGMHSETR